MEQIRVGERNIWETVLPGERARLARLCAYWTGNRDAAEDLAQETLVEAWRHREKLADPAGYAAWLSAIAKNVCLRWKRQQERAGERGGTRAGERGGVYAAAHSADAGDEDRELEMPDPQVDIEIELEREELADLLDRALALLPADTREALVQKYIVGSPQAEIAARLGVSEGAVEARLQRGKLTLHRILVTDLHDAAAAYGLIDNPSAGWQETRIWCAQCGQRRLWGRLPAHGGQFELHCPNCSWTDGQFFAQSSMMSFFDGVKGFKASLRRFDTWIDGYLRPGLAGGRVRCWRCGNVMPLHRYMPAWAPAKSRGHRGVHVKCDVCGSSSYSELDGMALDLPQVQKFWQRHPRIHTLPQQEIDFAGRPALLVRLHSVTDAAQAGVIVARDTYEVLDVSAEG